MKNYSALLERRELDIEPVPEDFPADEVIEGMINPRSDDPVVEHVRKLGYTPPSVGIELQKRVAEGLAIKEAKRKAQASSQLIQALRQAGIKPFTNKSVERYKKKTARGPMQLVQWDVSVGFLVAIIMISLIANMLTFAAVLLLWGVWPNISLDVALAFGFMLELVLLFVTVPRLSRAEASGTFTVVHHLLGIATLPVAAIFVVLCSSRYEWRKTPLEAYKKDIPREVLETVAEVHFHAPNAAFYIDELVQKQDPFLVVEQDDERYYIEVWKEPNFKGTRIA